MKKPNLIICENLLLPVLKMESELYEIKGQLKNNLAPSINNGLFVMLISNFETCLKEILKYYFKYTPNELFNSSSKIALNQEKISDLNGFYLLDNIIESQLNGISYFGLSKLFFDTLKIQVPQNILKINVIKERRNQLLHYSFNMNQKQKSISLNWIEIQEINDAIIELEQYFIYLKESIQLKYKDKTKLNAALDLWNYTFNNKLNFEQFWHLDKEDDSIFGYAKPKFEKEISKSEKFIIEVWKSQICGGTVDFINLSSLDNHFKECLFLFLQFSDDSFFY